MVNETYTHLFFFFPKTNETNQLALKWTPNPSQALSDS